MRHFDPVHPESRLPWWLLVEAIDSQGKTDPSSCHIDKFHGFSPELADRETLLLKTSLSLVNCAEMVNLKNQIIHDTLPSLLRSRREYGHEYGWNDIKPPTSN